MKKGNRITYLDTYGDNVYNYADFVEYCEEQNCDVPKDSLNIPAEDSWEYREWVWNQVEDDIDCFFMNLKYSDWAHTPVVVSGNLGLWWGKPTIKDTMFDSLDDAIRECWKSCDYVQLILENGVLYFVGLHHDGRNCFEIRPLTERGADKMRDGEEINMASHWHCGKFGEYLY